MSLSDLMGGCSTPAPAAKVAITEVQEEERVNDAKVTPIAKIAGPGSSLLNGAGHHGKTAKFAMQETFAKLQAKLDSAQEKQDIMLAFGKNVDPFSKKNVESYQEEPTAIQEVDDDDEDFARPSGRASARRNNPRTPRQSVARSSIGGDHETPSAFGGSNLVHSSSQDKSKRTRMGSTDGEGNRLSVMPGEGRPSLDSVTPYDDKPDLLIAKVERV